MVMAARNQIELVMFSGDHRFGMDMKLNSMLIGNAEAAFHGARLSIHGDEVMHNLGGTPHDAKQFMVVNDE